MQYQLSNLYAKIQSVFMQEDGQDLIEYALVVALIAFAATVGMNQVASGINTAFNQIAGAVSSNIT